MTSLSVRYLEDVGDFEHPIGENINQQHLYYISDTETSGTDTESDDVYFLPVVRRKKDYKVILQEEEFIPE